MNHFIILAFGSLQMENNGLFTGNSSNFWSKHSVPPQVIQTFIAIIILQQTREQRQPKSTLVKTIQQSLFHWGERIRPFSCCFLDISLVTLTILSPPYATTDIDEQYADIMLTRQVKEMLSHPFNLITNQRQTTHQTVNLKKQISKT